MLTTLETTAIATWVGESLYAYPGLLACHIVGLAIVVGVFAMRDLRLLGVAADIDLAVFLELKRLAYAGFTINLVSGLLLFSSQASYLATSIPFLSKIVCVATGMVLAFFLNGRLGEDFTGSGHAVAIDAKTRGLACLSLACWCAAIIAGRLIAYIF
ncbi:MAG: hypothetical protein MI746_18655 [Pseudomonadales bacterium]|nr:hypothetical protein [Pseudomonadales bacterium]